MSDTTEIYRSVTTEVRIDGPEQVWAFVRAAQGGLWTVQAAAEIPKGQRMEFWRDCQDRAEAEEIARAAIGALAEWRRTVWNARIELDAWAVQHGGTAG